MNRTEYEKWINEAVSIINNGVDELKTRKPDELIKNIGVGSTQYIPKSEGNIDIVFLGHDAHEGGGLNKISLNDIEQRFRPGNHSPYVKYVKHSPSYWREYPEWKFWNNFEKKVAQALSLTNEGERFTFEENGRRVFSYDIIQNMIVTNAILFNYSGGAKDLNNVLGPKIVKACMDATRKLIFDVIKPKLVICASIPLVFRPLVSGRVVDNDIMGKNLKHFLICEYKNDNTTPIIIIGIKHTSYGVNDIAAKIIADVIMSISNNNRCDISEIEQRYGNIECRNNKIYNAILTEILNRKPYCPNIDETQSKKKIIFNFGEFKLYIILKDGHDNCMIGLRRICSVSQKHVTPIDEYQQLSEYIKTHNYSHNKWWNAYKRFDNFQGDTDDEVAQNILKEIREIVSITDRK